MKITKAPTVSEFLTALDNLFENAELVCKLLVAMVDVNNKAFDEIIKARPRLTYNFLGNLERVGRGQLYFGLICDSSPGARKLLSLPSSMQREIYEKPVKVVEIQRGKAVVVEKPIQQLTSKEVKLAFEDSGRPRAVELQTDILSTPHQPVSTPAQRYAIISDRLNVIMAHTEFDIQTLETIIEQMKRNALKTLPSSMKNNQIK